MLPGFQIGYNCLLNNMIKCNESVDCGVRWGVLPLQPTWGFSMRNPTFYPAVGFFLYECASKLYPSKKHRYDPVC
jgi:hypothetical protein